MAFLFKSIENIIFRIIFHTAIIIIPIIIITNPFNDIQTTRFFIAVFTITVFFIIILIDIIRLNNPFFNKAFYKLFSIMMKSQEKNKINGVIPMFLGLSIILLIFSEEVIIMSIFFLAFGDSCAKFFGQLYKNTIPPHLQTFLYNNKTRYGSIAFFISCILSYLLLVMIMNYIKELPEQSIFYFSISNFICIIFVSLFTTIVELFSSNKSIFTDDNLLVLLLSAFGIVISFFTVNNIFLIEILDITNFI